MTNLWLFSVWKEIKTVNHVSSHNNALLSSFLVDDHIGQTCQGSQEVFNLTYWLEELAGHHTTFISQSCHWTTQAVVEHIPLLRVGQACYSELPWKAEVPGPSPEPPLTCQLEWLAGKADTLAGMKTGRENLYSERVMVEIHNFFKSRLLKTLDLRWNRFALLK